MDLKIDKYKSIICGLVDMATDTNFVIKFNTCSSDKISKCLSLKCIQNNDDRKPLSFALTAGRRASRSET